MSDAFKNAFQGFDPNNMDFNQAGNWPIGVKIVVYLIVFSVVIGAGVHFLIRDKHDAVEREIAKEVDLKSEYQRKAFQVASLDALRKQMADVEGRFAEDRKSVV